MSYDETLPTDKDKARALLGDTVTTAELLTDAHIEAVLDMQGSLSACVSWLASELIALFGQRPVRITANGKTVDFSARIPVWTRLAGTVVGGTFSATAFSVTPSRSDGYSEAADAAEL